MDRLGCLGEFNVVEDMIYFILRKLKTGVKTNDACFIQYITETEMVVTI